MSTMMVGASEALVPGGAYDRNRNAMQGLPQFPAESFIRHDNLGYISNEPDRQTMWVSNIPVPMGMLSGYAMPSMPRGGEFLK